MQPMMAVAHEAFPQADEELLPSNPSKITDEATSVFRRLKIRRA
jgi:hypothetical protein